METLKTWSSVLIVCVLTFDSIRLQICNINISEADATEVGGLKKNGGWKHNEKKQMGF